MREIRTSGATRAVVVQLGTTTATLPLRLFPELLPPTLTAFAKLRGTSHMGIGIPSHPDPLPPGEREREEVTIIGFAMTPLGPSFSLGSWIDSSSFWLKTMFSLYIM